MPIYNSNSELLYLAHLTDEHLHSISKCSVNNASAPVFTASTASWVYGPFVELIAANTVTKEFDLHYLNAGAVSDVGTYQFEINKGTAGSESVICTGRIVRLSNQTGAASVPIQTPILPANTRVSMRISSNITSSTLVASVQYHEY